MFLSQIYEKYILRFCGVVSVFTGLAIFLNAQFNMGLNSVLIVLAAVVFTALFVLFDLFRKRLFFYITFAVCTAVLIAIFLLASVPVSESFRWLFYSRNSDAENALTYALISQSALLFAAVGVVFNLLRFKCARLAFSAALSAFCVVMAVLQKDADALEIILIFTFIFCVLHEWILVHKFALTRLLHFMLIAAIITAILPSKQEPIQWEIVRGIIRSVQNIAENLSEQFTLIFGGNTHEFGLNIAGYSDSGRLGSGITDSEREALKITNFTYSGSNIYLTGTAMDNYTGAGWTRENNLDEFGAPEFRLDKIELLLALLDNGILALDEEARDEIFMTREIGLTYIDPGTRTRTLFYPLKNFDIITPLEKNTFGASMFFNRPMSAGTEYRLKYIDLNYQNQSLVNLLNNSVYQRPDYTSNELAIITRELIPDVFFGTIPDDYTAMLAKRRTRIHDVYTVLPSSVPERVYDLSREITENHVGNYAKMRAIEQYLSQNFRYTKTPQKVTGGDFTDTFLFSLQEGFCTYFATVAAVMGRTVGIPTRYVQGYSIDVPRIERFANYNIKGNSAHAWVEAYIDGFGWVPFEPSPGFSTTRYGEWLNQRPGQAQQTPRPPQSPPPPPPQRPENTPDEQKPAEQQENIFIAVLIAGAAIIIIVVSAVIIGVYVMVKRIKKRYTSACSNVRFLTDYKIILLLHEFRSEKPRIGETVRQFAARLEDDEFLKITGVFEAARYGEKGVNEAFAKDAADYKEKLLNEVGKGFSQRFGKIKYYLYLTNL
jgi:transglutaminase-like putative cysteine protease